jgi:hypothetical protein
MDPIYKTPFRRTIDLSKIVSIGDPNIYWDSNGYLVLFEILYIGETKQSIREYVKGNELEEILSQENIDEFSKIDNLSSIKRVKKGVDEIIEAWKEFRQSN